jgi:hypothetical protein
MLQRVYIDTSVIGGYLDKEFAEWSELLFEDFRKGKRLAVVSDITIDELSDAPLFVREILDSIPEKFMEVVLADTESRKLADLYILEKAVTKKFYEDALHISIATINQINVLSSWNFKHIVNLERIRQYNAVNLKNGYSLLEIRTPREIVTI